MKRFVALLSLLAALLGMAAHAEVAVPPLTQRVTDLTATLDANQVRALSDKLAALETAKGAQLAILLVPTTQPETVEQYALRVAEAWRLGRKGVDDGALLLVAKEDRKLRIEVGYGLEGALNDATAKRIISEIITPAFKQGDFYGGLDAGVEAIARVVQGEPLPPPQGEGGAAAEDTLGNLLGIGFVIFLMGNLILRQLIGRLPSGLVVGALVGGLAWLMLASVFAALVIGFIVFVLSLTFGSHAIAHSGGFGGGSAGGHWSGGGSSWGGGGGSFGGGGASGNW